MRLPSILSKLTSVLPAIVIASISTTALAAAAPSTRLTSCRTGSCLLVQGRRADVSSAVSIDGHAVAVEGQRSWRVRLPVDSVREWSTPHARTITISLLDTKTREATVASANLPIGMLGHAENLAFLVISAR